MFIAAILGARPQFIKAAPVSKALSVAGHRELLVHTGQHFDHHMSQVFFDELGLPAPACNLGVGSGTHGSQTGQMLVKVEEVLLAHKPDAVLVYGDTNSTLAGALAACKLHIPLAHVEAGLRSFNREMPEEHNRVLTDHCSDLLFCPTQAAEDNLRREGLVAGVRRAGDTMYDAVVEFSGRAEERSRILKDLGLEPDGYLLATVHRPSNADNPTNLRAILEAFLEAGLPVAFPVHPRTRKQIERLPGLEALKSGGTAVRLLGPLGYLDMIQLERHARLILTDSGGIQKEAFFFGVPCITLREETEWVETVEAGWNALAGASKQRILELLRRDRPPGQPPALYGDGHAARQIVKDLGTPECWREPPHFAGRKGTP